MTAAPYLTRLNREQRVAVEHGRPSPLLIIAGAGTGKTNTLAHRVAHLIVLGADPRRLLLLTFSRRAAVEMIRRVERIAAHVRSTRSARVFCTNMPSRSGSTAPSPSTTARTPPT